jgi:uroporphyrin-III C-methyltransferase/precorrin-2 dehydrogenase/sirohydrochlorin ferrochelatase
MYPVMLSVDGHRCLVVGGGGVAARRVNGLVAEGALVTVIAIEPVPALVRLAEAGDIELETRAYQAGEATNFTLVFAATDDRDANRQVFDDAKGAGIWVNVADDPPLCTFHVPARVRRPPLELAIASCGDAPIVTRRLRQLFERRMGNEWTEWIEAAARFRAAMRKLADSTSQREQEVGYDHFFEQTLNARTLATRVPSEEEMAEWLPGDSTPAAFSSAPEIGRADTQPVAPAGEVAPGLVSLIGGGPGDPGLLTLRARQRLLAADVVAYDRLAAPALPCDLRADVELHCVGKTAGNHPVPQEEIIGLIIRLAKQGKRVARLKGGDPMVFGRGREEARALVEAGVPFEVVPSVTAGVAVPAYAGIPVTSRNEVVRLTLVTAHEAVKKDGPQVRWDLIASDPHATIVGYMGVSNIGSIVDKLIDGGMASSTPAAMIERGTTSGQRMVRASIAELPEAVKAAKLRPPALFVIGPAVRHSEALDWFSTRPLFGERIGLFASDDATLAETLELAGAEMIEVPCPVTPSARVVMGALPISGWLLRDASEVESIDDERDGRGWSAKVVGWCLSGAAAERARELGWQNVVELEGGADADGIAAAIRARRVG